MIAPELVRGRTVEGFSDLIEPKRDVSAEDGRGDSRKIGRILAKSANKIIQDHPVFRKVLGSAAIAGGVMATQVPGAHLIIELIFESMTTAELVKIKKEIDDLVDYRERVEAIYDNIMGKWTTKCTHHILRVIGCEPNLANVKAHIEGKVKAAAKESRGLDVDHAMQELLDVLVDKISVYERRIAALERNRNETLRERNKLQQQVGELEKDNARIMRVLDSSLRHNKVEEEAYFISEDRRKKNAPGDARGDWFEAERRVKERESVVSSRASSPRPIPPPPPQRPVPPAPKPKD